MAAFISGEAVVLNRFVPGVKQLQFSNGGLTILPCHLSCTLIDPANSTILQSLREGFILGQQDTNVQPSGELAYLSKLRLNVLTDVTPNFRPASSTTSAPARLLSFQTGFRRKSFVVSLELALLGCFGRIYSTGRSSLTDPR